MGACACPAAAEYRARDAGRPVLVDCGVALGAGVEAVGDDVVSLGIGVRRGECGDVGVGGVWGVGDVD